jgi:hypothetical protein
MTFFDRYEGKVVVICSIRRVFRVHPTLRNWNLERKIAVNAANENIAHVEMGMKKCNVSANTLTLGDRKLYFGQPLNYIYFSKC